MEKSERRNTSSYITAHFGSIAELMHVAGHHEALDISGAHEAIIAVLSLDERQVLLSNINELTRVMCVDLDNVYLSHI